MKLGAFMMPAHPQHRSLHDGHYHDLDTLEFFDRTGFAEAWIGEHYMMPAEPCPSPDLLLAQAFLRTKRIRLAPGAFMLPFHHPAELAHRICMLDHISQGRLMVGIGASGTNLDLEMFDIDYKSGAHREMTAESIAIMTRFWESDGPFEYRGKYWTARRPADLPDKRSTYHLKPFQAPYPPIGVTGLSASSPTLRLAGANGWIPISFCFTPQYLHTHWDVVEEGARAAGRPAPDRSEWRVSRPILVADTDREAWRRAVDGEMGRYFRDDYLPMLAGNNALGLLKEDPGMPDSDVTVEYVAKHCWIVGSPDTVRERIEAMQALSGGFGVLHVMGFDHLDEMSAIRDSHAALAEIVANLRD
ncbi:LLM class flavin-dependent oxidoreductase [Burkholderia sp. F1]|uniref:LLM class flavin-dependent oxidoreductase n=1 Tax=Burkholderia sp. F1 TaxID=3366817 RepID=UPI003D746BFE